MMKPGAFAKKQKCECCENPWNLADGERSASTVDCREHVTGIDPKNFDNSVNPVDDFYSWSNGGWKKNNPIPAAYPRWGVFNVLNDVNQDRLKEILDELEKGEVSGGDSVTAEEKEERKKLCDFYNSFMKEEAVEESGLKDLNNHLQRAFGVSTANKHEVIADLHKIDVSVLFGLYSSPDKDDSSHTMAHFSQSGLGLPDRDYYFDSDKKEKREKYILYMESLFKELSTSSVEGVSEAYSTTTQQRAAAKQVYDFEKLLAEAHLTKTEARDVDRTFNKMTLAELNKLVTPDMTWGQYLTKGRLDQDRDVFNFETYLSHFGKSDADIGVINVRTVDALKRVGSCVESAIVSGALKHYLAFHIIDSFAPYLSSNFLNLHFNFFQKELLGTKELKPRWKRALDAQENLLGEAMGKLYVSKFFKAESKQKALRVVELVRDALRERLGEVEWMCDETRKEANKKMESFVVKIGYPDKFQNYEALTAITSDSSLAKNMMAGREFHFQLDLSRMNTPTDRGRWFMSPQTINAYYHPMLNEIVFPAAILQPPFFDTDADEAVQFGSLGFVLLLIMLIDLCHNYLSMSMCHGHHISYRVVHWRANAGLLLSYPAISLV